MAKSKIKTMRKANSFELGRLIKICNELAEHAQIIGYSEGDYANAIVLITLMLFKDVGPEFMDHFIANAEAWGLVKPGQIVFKKTV